MRISSSYSLSNIAFAWTIINDETYEYKYKWLSTVLLTTDLGDGWQSLGESLPLINIIFCGLEGRPGGALWLNELRITAAQAQLESSCFFLFPYRSQTWIEYKLSFDFLPIQNVWSQSVGFKQASALSYDLARQIVDPACELGMAGNGDVWRLPMLDVLQLHHTHAVQIVVNHELLNVRYVRLVGLEALVQHCAILKITDTWFRFDKKWWKAPTCKRLAALFTIPGL